MIQDFSHLPYLIPAAVATLALLWFLRGRVWALIYVALIPFVNWSFTWAPELPLPLFSDVSFNPVTIVTGLVLVVRDFAQREMGHRVLIAMAVALAWSVYYAGPELALASGLAFAIAEMVDWALFTFTRFRLSTRIFLSSLIAAPLDSLIFLYGAEFVRDGMFTFANWSLSVFGKLLGAAFVAFGIRPWDGSLSFQNKSEPGSQNG